MKFCLRCKVYKHEHREKSNVNDKCIISGYILVFSQQCRINERTKVPLASIPLTHMINYINMTKLY